MGDRQGVRYLDPEMTDNERVDAAIVKPAATAEPASRSNHKEA